MKISCQESITDGDNFAQKVANLEKYGFDGIELNGNRLHDEKDLAERRAVLKSSKVRPSSICGGFPCELVHAEPAKRRAAADAVKRFLDIAADLGAAGPISVPIFNNNVRVPDLSPWKTQHQLEVELLTEVLREIVAHAESAKVALLLEPLNRYESTSLKNVGEAAGICRALGGKGAKVMADFFHMNIEERSTPKAFEEIADVLGHVHLADNTRLEPGTGCIDFKSAFRVLKQKKFGGYMALECGLSDKASVALPKCAQYLRACIAEA
ncbi:MAG: sugar phosphate isomerase/epimerase [Planctomycetota bacterium]|nr:sugar phosphate isomerase/epimerase [Planctomycetota bacterium]